MGLTLWCVIVSGIIYILWVCAVSSLCIADVCFGVDVSYYYKCQVGAGGLNYLREIFFPRTCRAPFRMRGGYCGRACKRRGRRRDSVKVVPTLKMKTPEVLCTICQEEIELNAKCRKMPACKHIFHVECIDTWIAIRKHCPNCRSDITV